MLKEARLDRIVDLVAERGEVTVAELNDVLHVSEATIRRDLDRLSRLGRLRRSHGGAMRATAVDIEAPLALRESALRPEKERIGREAARHVHRGDRIFLCSGTTVETMPPHLRGVADLTVVTNSIPVVTQLADRADIELIVVGGVFRHREQSLVSQLAERMVAELRVDTVFLGCRALDPVDGITADSVMEASTDQAILQIARRRIVLTDHTKFRRAGTITVTPLNAIDVLITDEIDTALAAELRALDIEVCVPRAASRTTGAAPPNSATDTEP